MSLGNSPEGSPNVTSPGLALSIPSCGSSHVLFRKAALIRKTDQALD